MCVRRTIPSCHFTASEARNSSRQSLYPRSCSTFSASLRGTALDFLGHSFLYEMPFKYLLRSHLTRLQLLAVSILTIVSLTTTIVLHCFYGLNPILNTLLNAALTLLWAVSFSLLSWWTSGTLSHVCDNDNWENDVGVSVCRLYKALFTFSLLGLFSTIMALVLDVHVQRQAVARGRFQQIGLVSADAKTGQTVDGQRSSSNSSAAKQTRGGEGYAVPDEQFAYGDDTTYQGAARQLGHKSVEQRLQNSVHFSG